ncbi:MAG: prolyl oligopeptidase family serine peptidase [Candidatus Thiodiazotropha sp.]
MFALLLPLHISSAQVIETQTGIEYCSADGLSLLMDYAYPDTAGTGSRLPAVVLIHGGGWRSGQRGAMLPKTRQLADHGYFAATIDYRLTRSDSENDPMRVGADYRDIIQDVKCAVRHLKSNADSYGIDPQRIATFGTSAGAHLAAMIGVNRTDWHDNNGQYQEVDSSVAAVVNWFGPQDLKYVHENSEDSRAFIEDLLQGTPDEMPARYYTASPINHLDPDDPAIITIHGSHDGTVPVGVAKLFHEACLNMGVEHELNIVPDGTHGLSEHQDMAMNKTIMFLNGQLK